VDWSRKTPNLKNNQVRKNQDSAERLEFFQVGNQEIKFAGGVATR